MFHFKGRAGAGLPCPVPETAPRPAADAVAEAERSHGNLGDCSGAGRSGQLSSHQLTAGCVVLPVSQAP